MSDKFLSYNDIKKQNNDVIEKLDTQNTPPDPHMIGDIIILFKMQEINNQIDNFLEIKENALDMLYDQLYHVYDKHGVIKDDEYNKKHSKKILEHATWDDERTLVTEKDKMEVLQYIKQRGMMIDSITFIDDEDDTIKCLSSMIEHIDPRNDEYEDEEPFIVVVPEFILNKGGHIEPGDEDESIEVGVDQIREIIFDETKYTFMF